MKSIEEIIKENNISKYSLCKAIGGSYWNKDNRPNIKMLQGWGKTFKSTLAICNGLHKLTDKRFSVQVIEDCMHDKGYVQKTNTWTCSNCNAEFPNHISKA